MCTLAHVYLHFTHPHANKLIINFKIVSLWHGNQHQKTQAKLINISISNVKNKIYMTEGSTKKWKIKTPVSERERIYVTLIIYKEFISTYVKSFHKSIKVENREQEVRTDVATAQGSREPIPDTCTEWPQRGQRRVCQCWEQHDRKAGGWDEASFNSLRRFCRCSTPWRWSHAVCHIHMVLSPSY